MSKAVTVNIYMMVKPVIVHGSETWDVTEVDINWDKAQNNLADPSFKAQNANRDLPNTKKQSKLEFDLM
jgi:hypothetical protein